MCGGRAADLQMHLLSTAKWSRNELNQLIDSAMRFKRGDDQSRPLAGRSVALVFFNPSLRTRASMQIGIYELGGNAVVLDHGLGVYTIYFHLEKFLVNAGEKVRKGQEIGRVGATGRATGPHLHFGIRLQGARIDPAALLRLSLL